MARQELVRGVQVNNVATPGDVIFDNTAASADIEQLVLKIGNLGAAPVVFTAYVRDNAAAAVADTDFEDQVTVPIGATKYMDIPILIDDDQILGLVDVDEVRVTVYEENP